MGIQNGTTLENSLAVLVKFNIHLAYDTSILAALGFYPPKVKIMSTQKFVQISFIYDSLKLESSQMFINR